MVPFVEVLLHSWMDFNRVDEDREINHHGKTINIGAEGQENEVNDYLNQDIF